MSQRRPGSDYALAITAARCLSPAHLHPRVDCVIDIDAIQVQELLSTVSEETNIAEVSLKVCLRICLHAACLPTSTLLGLQSC